MPENLKTVIAVGHTFGGLEIERAFFSTHQVQLLDGNDIPASDPNWASADGVMLGTATKMDAATIQSLESCIVIVRYGMGYDNVDVEAARAKGILVGVLRDYCVNEVAEHTIASALCLARGLPMWDRLTRAGKWRSGADVELRRFSELTYGVVGYGQIGRRVAEMAQVMFGKVKVFDPAVPTDTVDGMDVLANLEGLLRASDIVSLHVPSIPATRKMIGLAQLELMGPGTYLVNHSRGDLIDEDALLNALDNKTIAGAALDTFESEPVSASHPLVASERVLLSPHVAWKSREAEKELRLQTCREMLLALTERRLNHPI